MCETLVIAENIGKKFCRDLKQSLWYGVKDLSYELMGLSKTNGNLRKHEFWSVKNVNFEVKRGECLGLIGPNGAGKSTLLKMLHGLIKMDEGRIKMRGRVGALIELGAGFNPILTGRENIFVNGAVLGFSKKDIKKKLDLIIDFAEIGDFIDAPVQSYSSGMKVRLGFAIAAQMEPDILLIDEVLAVGDVGFRSKCYNAIYDIASKAAVIFVTHHMGNVGRLCSKVLVMQHGKINFYGSNVPKAIEEYLDLFDSDNHRIIEHGESKITNIKLSAKKIDDYYEITFGEDLTIEIDAYIEQRFKNLEASITILSHGLDVIAQCNSKHNKIKIPNNHTPVRFEINLPKLCLSPGKYYITIILRDADTNTMLCWHYASIKLKVIGDFYESAHLQIIGDWNIKKITT